MVSYWFVAIGLLALKARITEIFIDLTFTTCLRLYHYIWLSGNSLAGSYCLCKLTMDTENYTTEGL